MTFFFCEKKPKLIILINPAITNFLIFWKNIQLSFFINVSLCWTFSALNVQDNFNKLNVCFVKLLNFLFTDRTFVFTFFFDEIKQKLIVLISSSITLFLMFWKYIRRSFFINVSLSWTFALSQVQENFDKLNVYFGKLLGDFFTDRTFVFTFFFSKKKPKFINLINLAMALFSICKKLLWS